jgi:chromosome segregation ATPase
MKETQFKQAVDDVISNNGTIKELKTDVSQLKTDVSQLKTDVSELKTDVSQLKTDVSQLKTDVSQLKTDVSQLKHTQEEMNTRLQGVETEQHRQGLIQEDMQKDLRTIAQAVTPLLKNSTKTQTIEDQLRDQKDQIEVTQIALRDHFADPLAHQTQF